MTTSARRQLFRRSKAGCWNCRSKKKKCDELRPHCTRCIRAGESCRYPDTSSDSSDPHASIADNGYVSPSMPSSASFPSNLSRNAVPMLSRSSSSASFSSQHHSRHGQRYAYQHHPYAPSPDPAHHPLQHRDFHPQRTALHQRPSPPPPYNTHHPYHNPAHGSVAPIQPPQHQYPPPPMSASAAAEWDHTSQQHISKRTRYDDSSSSNSSNAALQDARARQQPFDVHHRIPSNQSQTSSKGKSRDALPPLSPHQSYSVPMASSASLPPLSALSSSAQRSAGSPVASIRSANTSPTDHASPVFPGNQRPSSGASAAFGHTIPDARLAAQTSFTSHQSALTPAQSRGHDSHQDASDSDPAREGPNAPEPRTKLVFDYNSTEPDPEVFLSDLHAQSLLIVTQPTKGAEAYFRLLKNIARMHQGQAMAHALAAMIATHQAKLYSLERREDRAGPASPPNSKATSPSIASHANASRSGSGGSADDHSTQLLELADRHHLAAIKALQTQQQPSRRRRFSVIETNSGNGGDELPLCSNAAAMMLLILACGSAGKSLMLPSYFNQCEQFLADAVQDVSSRRLFPSVTGDPVVGNAEDPPIQTPEELDTYCLLLFIGTVVGLYECYLAQYTAIADWDYNPARLRRLIPFNCSASDLAIFDNTRAGVSETTFTVSIVTLELVIETLDTMRKFKRAESAAYGNRKSSRSEAEDGVAALDSLALREELGLIIRDLEAGTFWKGPIRCFSNAEQLLIIDFIDGKISADTLADKAEEEAHTSDRATPGMPPPSSNEDRTCRAVTKAYISGDLVHAPNPGEPKQVNRLRLANHLYRNALLVDLYVNVFNRATSSLAVRELVSRSISLLGAVPDKLERGLEWPVIVLGSYAQDDTERNEVRSFFKRSQWKGTAGPVTAAQIIERVWAEDAPSWRESAIYFGSPYLS